MFLDMKMRFTDGFEVLDWLQLQPHLRSILVIVLTGAAELVEVKRAYKMGAHSFMVKPCHREDILNLIKNFPNHWTLREPSWINRARSSEKRPDR